MKTVFRYIWMFINNIYIDSTRYDAGQGASRPYIELPHIFAISCRLRGGTLWRYDGKAACMSKQTVTLLYCFWRPAERR